LVRIGFALCIHPDKEGYIHVYSESNVSGTHT